MSSFVIDDYRLDITPQGNYPVVYLSQFEDGRDIRFYMLNRGRSFTIPTGISAFVSGLKSNGGYYEHLCTIDGNYVIMPVEADMTDASGRGLANIKFTNQSGDTVISAKFVVNVQESVSDSGIEVPTVAETIFQQLLDEIRQCAADLNLNIEQFKQDINDEVDTFESGVDSDITALDARVDNFINTFVPNSVETLWTGLIKNVGDTATLSADASNFDFIDIYMLSSTDTKFYRVPSSQTSLQVQTQNLSDDASSNFLRLWEIGVSISGTTVSINKVIAWVWDDPNSANPTVTANAQNGDAITRIDGVRIASDTPAEVTDIRVGADGMTYNSAGAAVRGQISDLKSDLTGVFADKFWKKEASGTMLSVDDALYGKVLSGTGSGPVKRAGKNLLTHSLYENQQRSGVYCHVAGDGSLTFTGTSTGANVFACDDLSLPAGTYTVNGFLRRDVVDTNCLLQIRVNDTQVAAISNTTSRTITLSEQSTVSVRMYFASGFTFNNGIVWAPQLTIGTTASDYEKATVDNFDSITSVIMLPGINNIWGSGDLSVKYATFNGSKTLYMDSTVINNTNGPTELSDLDTVEPNSIKGFVKSSDWEPAHMPSDALKDQFYTLFTYKNGANSSGSGGTIQILVTSYGNIYMRYKLNPTTWLTWIKHEYRHEYVVASDGSGDYTAVVPAVIQATKTPNSRVFIKDGTYDLISEIETYVSSTFFSNYTTSQLYGTGIHLYNGVTIEMSSNAKITCHYTGGNVSVRSNFAPFVANYGDFTMLNVTIEASNVRYCVHDDNITKKVMPSHHKYVGCSFTLDNTGLQGTPDTCAVIGGGLDYSSFIEVEDCYFNSLGSPTKDIVNTHYLACAGYHNTNVSNARSHVIFKNCYCGHGTLTFGMYGDTTKITNIEVSNCSLKYQPYTYFEAQSQYAVENMELRRWNNEIRS